MIKDLALTRARFFDFRFKDCNFYTVRRTVFGRVVKKRIAKEFSKRGKKNVLDKAMSDDANFLADELEALLMRIRDL